MRLDDMAAWKHNLVVAVLLAIFFLQACTSLINKSSTWDETHYFGMGRYILAHQRWDVMGSILHPPLSFYVGSIPLLFQPLDEKLWEKVDENDLNLLGGVDVVRGQAILATPQNHHNRLLIASRLMTTLLALLLAFHVYRFSSSLYGRTGGLLSLALFAFCPNMLAFAGIAGPDMPLTAFSFIFVYYWWRASRHGSLTLSVIAGVVLGLALLSKYSALILLPVMAVLSINSFHTERKLMVRCLAVALAVALFILFLGYGFHIKPYLQGITFQLQHARFGQDSFLMGEHSRFGWWYYFLVAFALKTPIPTIILFLAALTAHWRNRASGLADSLFLLMPIVAFFLFFSIRHQSIGLRYILPVYPFIFAAIGAVPAMARKGKYVIIALIVWQVVTSLRVFPHYLAYFNESIGGPDNGYKYLVDSNLDWGQDLIGLKKYLDRHGIKRISLSYFGTDSPQRYGIAYDWLPSDVLYNPEPDKQPVATPPGQLIAVSASNLQGLSLEDKLLYRKLRDYRPVAKIGYSIFIYDLGPTGTLPLPVNRRP